jgi:hypothetical protein
MTSAASTTAASTPAPPLATGPPHHSLLQPTLTRVALTCIYTARTSHSRHRLPLAARFHSTARAPADTFLVPARSPRNTRPSRRPPRSARPLVRPTSFMRTTTPRPPPAKALRAMSRLRCAQCEPGARSLQAPPSMAPSLPRGRLWPSRHDRPCLHACGHHAMIAPASSLCVACPRRRALRMSSRPSDGTLQSLAHRRFRARRPPRRSPRRPPYRTRLTRAISPRTMAILGRSASTTSATHRSLLPSR